MATFGELLGRFREERGMELKALANKAGFSDSYISVLISAKKPKKPSLKAVTALADALRLTTEEKNQLFVAAGLKPQAVEQLAVTNSTLGAEITGRDGRPYGRQDPREAGIEFVFPNLSTTVVHARIVTAVRRIHILESWLANPANYAESIRIAAQVSPKLEIKILILDPEYPEPPKYPESPVKVADLRAIDLEMPSTNFVSDQIQLAIRLFDELREELVNQTNIEVRLFKALPSVQYIACDDLIFIGFFLHGKQSDISPQLLIKEQSTPEQKTTLGKCFSEEFDRFWETAEPLVEWQERHKPVSKPTR